MTDGPGTAGRAVARGDARFPPGHSADAGDDDLFPVTGPVGALRVLDGAAALLRGRFGTLVGCAAALFLPVQVLALVLALTSGVDVGADLGVSATFGAVGGQGLWSVALVALQSLALALLGVAAGALVGAHVEGRRLRAPALLRLALGRWWVAATVVAVGACIKVPAACLGGVGWLFADAALFCWAVVAGWERLGPFAALRRTWSLTKPGYGTALGVSTLGLFVTLVAQLVLVAGPLALLGGLSLPEGWLLVAEQATGLVGVLTAAFTAAVAARGAAELRCRVEGWDLTRRARERGLAGG